MNLGECTATGKNLEHFHPYGKEMCMHVLFLMGGGLSSIQKRDVHACAVAD